MLDTSARLPVAVGSNVRRSAELLSVLAGGLIALLAAAAIVVAWRRLAGALERPLPGAYLVGVGGLLASAAGAARTAWRHGRPEGQDLSAELLISFSLLVLGAALTMPGANLAATIVFWGLVAGEECWAWRPAMLVLLRRRNGATERRPSSPLVASEDEHATVRLALATAVLEPAELPEVCESPGADAPAAPADDNVLQQLTLTRLAGGGQRLAGWLRMPLAAGQRIGNLHVAFCPAFARVPEVRVQQISGPAARIKPAQVLPYGVRMEVKLATVCENADSVLVEFSAEG